MKLAICALAALSLFTATPFQTKAAANEVLPIDLGPHHGKSQFDRFGIPWTIPSGLQVADGIPFLMGGIIELYGKSAIQGELNVRTNVFGISIERSFEEIHLLCATTGGSPTVDVRVATLHLNYADGTSSQVPILFGRHIRQWWGPRHEEDSPLREPANKPAWSMELSEAARANKRSRFYHATLTNPSPDKVVKTIDIKSDQSIAALMLAGLSVGPRNAAPRPNTLPNQPPDLDNRVRTGESAQLDGLVQDPNGKPLQNARVRIVGTRLLKTDESKTSTDHQSVGTTTTTDANGKFHFDDLPNDRLYRVQVESDGLEPSIFFAADPDRDPILVRLSPAQALIRSKKFVAHAKIVGLDGKPIIGASIEPTAVESENGTCYGCRDEFPTSLLSNSAGEFLLQRDTVFVRVQTRIIALGYAPAKVWLHPSNSVQDIVLNHGTTLIGKVIKDGQNLGHVEVAVSAADRNPEVFAGSYTARTDAEGRFTFKHLPADTSWYFHGVIDSMRSHGVLPPRRIASQAPGTTNDLGEVSLAHGLRLAGRVQSSSNEPLPSNLRIHLSFDTAGHSTSTSIAPDGSFELTGLYPGTVSISLNNSQWNPAPLNRSLDMWNGWQLVGKLEEDKIDFLFLVEKKPRTYNNHWNGNGSLPPQDQANSRPLAGAELSGPHWLNFAGTITDEKSGKFVKAKVTPGYKPVVNRPPAPKPLVKQIVSTFRPDPIPFHERIFWDFQRQQTFTNGTFALQMVPLSGRPVLTIEAEGYEPYETEPMIGSHTNLLIKLRPGSGPKGVVLQPDGTPAIGATIIYGAGGEQFGLSGKELSDYGHEKALQKTASNGGFSFNPRPGGLTIFASHASGWAQIDVEDIPWSGNIQLKPWASVSGRLVTKDGKPVADEQLALSRRNWTSGTPFINYQERPRTDSNGNFFFSTVPPGEHELVRLVAGPSRGSWTHQRQTPIYCEPGKTNLLGNVLLDTPPPPTVVEELKKKLGL